MCKKSSSTRSSALFVGRCAANKKLSLKLFAYMIPQLISQVLNPKLIPNSGLKKSKWVPMISFYRLKRVQMTREYYLTRSEKKAANPL